MSETICIPFLDEFEDWLAGQRSAIFAEHLANCANCRALLADCKKIREAAGELGAKEAEPPAHLWVSLKAQLKSEGIIAEKRPERRHQGFPRFVSHPAFAAAYAVILLAAGGLVFSGHLFRPSRQIAYALPDSQFPMSENQAFQTWTEPDPEIAATLRKNLALVDTDISLCKKSVIEEPNNELARDYLDDAYEQKAELLNQMAERGVSLQ